METQINIRGLEDAISQLDTDDLMELVKPGVQSGLIRVENRLKRYPPPIPGQKYRRGLDPRSERLGQRWTSRVTTTGSEVRGELGNVASYAHWVQSERFQARPHRNRWITDEAALEAEAENIEKDVQRVIIRGLGG